jgi:hypothetical protein
LGLVRKRALPVIRRDECATFFSSVATTWHQSLSSVSTHGANQIICSIQGIPS